MYISRTNVCQLVFVCVVERRKFLNILRNVSEIDFYNVCATALLLTTALAVSTVVRLRIKFTNRSTNGFTDVVGRRVFHIFFHRFIHHSFIRILLEFHGRTATRVRRRRRVARGLL